MASFLAVTAEKQKPELKDFLPLSSDDSHTPPLPVVKETVQQLLVDIIAKTLDTKASRLAERN